MLQEAPIKKKETIRRESKIQGKQEKKEEKR